MAGENQGGQGGSVAGSDASGSLVAGVAGMAIDRPNTRRSRSRGANPGEYMICDLKVA